MAAPQRHLLDRRADQIAEFGIGDADDLLSTIDVARWLGVSHQWLEIGRSSGYGPPYIRVAARRVRYRRADVLAWLKERTHCSTAEYESSRAKA
jgi:hypothetical protein